MAARMAVLGAGFGLAWLAAAASAVTVVLYPPPAPERAGNATLLVVVPGAFVPGTEYRDLAQRIQQRAQMPLWAAVLTELASDFPTVPEVTTGFADAVNAARAAGFSTIQNSDVWAIGHSQGAYVGSIVVSESYAGHIMMGSYLDTAPTQPLRDYAKPILHLGGDLDGLAQITRLAEEYIVPRELLLAGNERAAVYDKPVVFFTGMNHAQMGNGYVTDALRDDDFEAEITQDAATDLLAASAAAFLDLHRTGSPAAANAAFALLRSQLAESEPMVRFFLDAQQADLAGAWCANGQRLVANLRTDVADRLNVALVAYTEADPFIESKPSLEVSNGTADVVATAYLEYTIEVAVEGTYGYELDCKYKSQEAIANALDLAADAYGAAGTCQDVNAFIYTLAKGSVAPAAAARYAARGRPVVFLPDTVWETGGEWAPSHVVYNDTADGLLVTASSLQSRDGVPVFGGMTYCKGAPAARLAAWILHDALPRGLSA